jgi:imidazolonepropionase-like amidohydrolase
MTSNYLKLVNATVIDVQTEDGTALPHQSILVENGTIREVGDVADVRGAGAEVVDLAGRFVMPGLIDGHVHVTAWDADLGSSAETSSYYTAVRAARLMEQMLDRGFTTVRDVAGGDFGLARAVEEGHLHGPRLIFGGKALSQTGGHGDGRAPGRSAPIDRCCPTLSVVVDGADAVRLAAREELRKGAHHIKLMLGGGVASPTDRIDDIQFSVAEISAAVDAATSAGRYVTGHAYTSKAINRALTAGVRSIEHGNLMDDSSIPLFLEKDAFYVPTLVAYTAMEARGAAAGLPAASLEKNKLVISAGLDALDRANRAGVNIVFGSDLLGALQSEQSSEFRIRSAVQSPVEILRSATTVAAELIGMAGVVGVVAPQASADLLVLDRNPLDDAAILAEPQLSVRMVISRGRVHRSDL